MSTTIYREVSIPREAKTKMRAHAAASKSTLGRDVAALIESYADGGLNGAEGAINIATTDDPGFKSSDVRVRLEIDESVWEQARMRTIMDETTISSVVRRAAVALTADDR